MQSSICYPQNLMLPDWVVPNQESNIHVRAIFQNLGNDVFWIDPREKKVHVMT